MGDSIKTIEINQFIDGSYEIIDHTEDEHICGIPTKKEMNQELNKLFKSRHECYKEYSDKGVF